MKAGIIPVSSLIILATAVWGCNSTPGGPDKPEGLTGMSLSPPLMELVYGGRPASGQITAKPVPEDIAGVAFTYVSDHPGIATVSSTGLVTAKGTGSTFVTVTANGEKSDIVRVRVTAAVPTKYSNPVLRASTPDPTVIQVANGDFYLYATEDIRNIPIYSSRDLVNWKYVTTAFTNTTRPTFEPGGGLWAPDINYIDGKYVMYYSMSVWGGVSTCGIGIATASRPQGPFTDRGMLFRSSGIGVTNSIDPCFVEDGGRKYLFWGSFYGIYGIELSDDGLSLRAGSEKQKVAGSAYEAAYIHKRGNYYYLFASTGTCCNGLTSTYITVVGRSASLWGPYLNKQGLKMTDNKHEAVIAKNSSFVGTGHNSRIVQDNAGDNWILYHGYSVENTSGRSLLLDKVTWADDWPAVTGGSPSIESDLPVF